MTTSTDRIEKEITLKAPRSTVWRAVTDSQQFSTWFRVALEGPFVLGQQTRGRITYPGYEHMTMAVQVEAIEPERYFAFRWHPYEVADTTDFVSQPTTLVEFILEERTGGTHLKVVESGFDRVPASRRDEAFRSNERGWAEQVQNIERYLAEAAA